MERLDPAHLTPVASLNRLRILDLPRIVLPAEVRARTVYEFLSAAALADRVRRQALILDLGDVREENADTLLLRFDRCFTDRRAAVRAVALAEAERHGRYLGYVILALRRGDMINRQARQDWDDSYWAHWAAIATIYAGGGVVGGRLGPHLVAHAARTLLRGGMHDCAIRLASSPGSLPLIGAARTAPPNCRAVLVFDFGQSVVKRACASYRDGVLTALTPFPSVPSRPQRGCGSWASIS